MASPRRNRRTPRGERPPRGERGSVTAEFALVVPAVIVVLGCCLGAFQLASVQLRLENAAAVGARTMARGADSAAAATRVGQVVEGARLERHDRGDLVCAVARTSVGLGLLGPMNLSATSCSLAGGE
ncbi:TadE family protein [Lacisediminihabitans changchengi]|uniref:Pilus assembly protein n=1 Tax=Lacisediminihabitans changchengi TaxID=2787634 RepID=A0A934W5R1_9MICO|nr:TadE family protein [Lacisediminihabitans changchengi]MBK4348810.1 pilus assembly protein [Lacisediminihabitans changchengi]